MKIKVSEFEALARVATSNMLNFDVSIFEEIQNKTEEIGKEEFDLPLKRETVKEYVSLAFGDNVLNQDYVRKIDELYHATNKDSDIVVPTSRILLAEMEFSFDKEKQETFSAERKSQMERCMKDVSVQELDKQDTIEVSRSFVEKVSTAKVKEITFDDSIVTENFALSLKPKKDFKYK